MPDQSAPILILGLLVAYAADSLVAAANFSVRPLEIDLSNGVPRMLSLINNTQLPDEPQYPGLGSTFGMDLDFLKGLQEQWLTEFNWNKEQKTMNELKHFTATIEGLTIHYVHEKSAEPNAIPLVLHHGWPSSFLEFEPVIKPLTKLAKTWNGTDVAFDVVVPHLPGFGFSSRPPANWTFEDTARVFHTLMTEVLGYEKFAVHGTDLAAPVAYALYNQYNKTTRAAHFSFLPVIPPLPAEIAAANITLSPLEEFEAQRNLQYFTSQDAYSRQQQTEPNAIGLALYDNPVGILSWIAGKIDTQWADPRRGTPPSLLNDNDILKTVSFLHLTKTFVSTVFAYTQNLSGFTFEYTKASTDAPMLVSIFKYNSIFWPRQYAERIGNLVLYRNHEFGGHFPSVDNPPQFINDIREIGAYWQ